MATRYSLLHTKRAEMIVNLYSSVYDLQTTLQRLVNPLLSESDEAFNAHKHAEWRAVTDASVQFDRLAKTSAIFFHDAEQEAEARDSKAVLEKEGVFKRPIVTQILPAAPFYRAEEYHQQYFEKQGIRSCHI